jgi:hypothetical protein
VLVSLTADGRDTLHDFRARYRPLLLACLAALPDERVEALEGATDAMAALVQRATEGRYEVRQLLRSQPIAVWAGQPVMLIHGYPRSS